MGLLELSSDHYREAVLNFSSSAEQFLEYYIRIISLSLELDCKCIESAWKYLSKQSERQLGAFLWLYFMENSTPCEYFSNSVIKLRNKVAHKGYIPKKDESENYCKKVLEFIVPKYGELKDKQSIAVSTFLSNRKSVLNKKYSPQRDAAIIGFNTIVDHLILGSYDFESYKKFLSKISFH